MQYNNLYIRAIRIKQDSFAGYNIYPFNLSNIKNTEQINLNNPITFFVGENGSGKSTLLEAIAIAYGFNPEGGSINYRFATRETHSSLYENLILSRGVKRAEDGFFLRAESLYNVASYIDDIGVDIDGYGGRSLHQQSHGESFISLILNRFHGNGLYILDEPEAALSPQMQLTLMLKIKELSKDSQFIIATHSPILLGMDDSVILTFDNEKIEAIDYEETSSYLITKMFIENREAMLKRLFG